MNTIHQIIRNNNIIPKWFITIKFISTESFSLSNHDDRLNIKFDNNNIAKVEKEINYFINLLYQAVYGKTSTKKIKEPKFQILSFIEKGEANYEYHCHLITENINDKSIEELKEILSRIRIKHKGIRSRDTNAIDIIPYAYRHSTYVFKTFTKETNPLSILTSRINTNGQH
jgi:hypothetical protein